MSSAGAARRSPEPPVHGPLEGVRVLDYSQYVAGPFAALLLADLGADVVKVEGPHGDQWRHYEPFAPGESRYFHALNRNKRSVVVDLKTVAGRAASEALLRSADIVLHNMAAARAAAFGLDRETVRGLNPRAVLCTISAFGPRGPHAAEPAYDLVTQAFAGLLLADARPGDARPERSGGVAIADFAAGMLAALAAVAGLRERDLAEGVAAHSVEVSLFGAALAVQAQALVSVEARDAERRAARMTGPPLATRADLDARADAKRRHDELEPYYRTYAAADGYIAIACLNVAQRRALLDVLRLVDPWVENPQARPADAAERTARRTLADRVATAVAAQPASHWLDVCRAAGVPVAPVRLLAHQFECEQATANGYVTTLDHPLVGPVVQLGNMFHIDGEPLGVHRPAPLLGEHSAEVFGS